MGGRAPSMVAVAALAARAWALADAPAEGPSLEARVDRAEVRAADRVVLAVRLRVPTGAAWTLPEIGEKVGDFTVVSRERGSPRVAGGVMEVSERVTLEPFLPGTYMIPGLEGRATVGGREEIVRSGPIEVRVVSMGGGGEASEARGIVEAARRGTAAWWVAIAGAGTCALGGVAWAVKRRRGGGVPGHAEAIGELGAIEHAPEGSASELATRISVAARRGLDSLRGVGAEHMTPAEVESACARAGLDGARARRVLEACDAIRFGGASADGARIAGLAREAGVMLRSIVMPGTKGGAG